MMAKLEQFARRMKSVFPELQYEDVCFFYEGLCEFPWFHLLSETRQMTLLDMACMGWKRFLGLEGMIGALDRRDYEKAADEILESPWAQESKERVAALAECIRSGKYDLE